MCNFGPFQSVGCGLVDPPTTSLPLLHSLEIIWGLPGGYRNVYLYLLYRGLILFIFLHLDSNVYSAVGSKILHAVSFKSQTSRSFFPVSIP